MAESIAIFIIMAEILMRAAIEYEGYYGPILCCPTVGSATAALVLDVASAL